MKYMRFQNSGVYWKGPENTSYMVNGKTHELAEGKYMPDLVHERLLDFIKRHRTSRSLHIIPCLTFTAILGARPIARRTAKISTRITSLTWTNWQAIWLTNSTP